MKSVQALEGGLSSDTKSAPNGATHYKDWPNAQGFNVLGDQRHPVRLAVSGHIPSWAAGALYRTAPSAWKLPRANHADGVVKVDHWFDGFTTVHKFNLIASDGHDSCTEVWYSSHSHVDEAIEQARQTGRLGNVTFAQKRDPCESLYRKLKTFFFEPTIAGGPDKRNIGVVFRETLLAEANTVPETHERRRLLSITTDNSSAKHFDAETLQPLSVTEQHHVHPELRGTLSASHASHDPDTGDMFNYNLELGSNPTYRIFRVDSRTGQCDILATVSGPDIQPAYLHSLFLTPNFVIVAIWPAHLQFRGLSLLWHRNLLDSLAPYDPNAKTVWLVIDRSKEKRGLVKKFYSPAFFAFHSVNAWELPSADGTSVDVIAELYEFDNMDILHQYYHINLVSDQPGALLQGERNISAAGLVRYSLAQISLKGPDQNRVTASQVPEAKRTQNIRAPAAGDLPRINEQYSMRPHRYVYSMVDTGKSSFVDAIAKTDTQTGECFYWQQEKHTPGEPIFVPRPSTPGGFQLDEDDGVLLCVVLNGETGFSYLLCLDARTMQETGRADVGGAVGLGYHGIHIPV